MRILFAIGATSRIRNFQETLMLLADRGHEIRLTGRLRKQRFELPETVTHPRITGRVNPTLRTDKWRDSVDLLRGARDYVRYFDPRYAQATRLVRRAYDIAPTEVALFCERHPWVKRRWHAVAAALAVCEELIPSDPGIEAFLREERPDMLVVTPLVTFESYQTDYIKAAHRLGIPVVFIPFSWDNLTNKGLIRVLPDRVLVWNDLQRREAIELHGCSPDSVIVTGAARFDEFFERRPATSRTEFCARFGLDPGRPMLLYLGSSQLTGPNETELVRRWAESIRSAADATLRSCSILIRPHPALKNAWDSLDFSDLRQVGLTRHDGRASDQQELFDSIHHAHAAVGLNTSAMLEAAVVGRPVHTLMIRGFDEGQVGTMHFHYLVEAYGGLAIVARDFEEHHRHLSEVVRGEPACVERSRGFAEQFLRPHGIDQRVSPRLADQIERAGAEIVKRPRTSVPAWHYPARRALLVALEHRRAATVAAVDSTVIGTSPSLRAVKTALEELRRGTEPIFVGPWVDSITNELLYWIPFLRWAAEVYGFPAERLIVLSRAGTQEWYGSLAGRFFDFETLFSRIELEHWAHRTVPQTDQDPKQAVLSPFDREIVDRAARAYELADYQVLHPSLFFRVFRRLQKDRAFDRLADVLRHEPLTPGTGAPLAGLPDSYVAVSVGFTEWFPDTDENRDMAAALISGTAAAHELVVVDCPAPPVVARIATSARVHLLEPRLSGAARLDAQSRTLARARAFVGAHGDLAVLAAFCGIAATSYHSVRLPPDQLDRLQAAAARGRWGTLTVERARRFKGVRLPAGAHA